MKPFIYNQRRLRQSIDLLVCALGMTLFCTLSVNAQTASCHPQFIASKIQVGSASEALNSSCKNPVINPQAALEELAKADVVYLGETHDRLEDHQTQLQIVRELQKHNQKVAIAMEMFQHPYQDAIDRYLAGQLSEQELIQQTEYNQRWGFPWENYAPILRLAQEKQLPVLAINTPTEITRQVARSGLKSLTPQQRQLIPPFSEIRTDNPEYRQLLAEIFQQHQQSGHGNSSGFEQFFQAQVLWDETMAAEIASFLKANPKYQVVVLAGRGHIVYGYGIPSRVARRLKDRNLVQRSVLLGSVAEESKNKRAIADFIWQH